MEKTLKSTTSIEEVQKENSLLKQQVSELSAKLNWYEEQYRLSQQKRFGSSSEKTHPEQLGFFNEAETENKPELKEPTIEEITYKRGKQAGKREAQLENLPVETIEYKLADKDQYCPSCNSALHEMSTEIRRELKVIPAQVKVVEHKRYVYACRNCEKTGVSTPVITAPMPAPVISGSLASPSAVAFVMNQKFVEAMPLYRQEQQFTRLDITLSRQTLSNWMIECSQRWLQPLYDRMKEHLIRKNILHADETTLQVLNEAGKEASSKSYMWLYRTGREGPPIILYDYQTTRASKHPKAFLTSFKGYLHVDGYQGYNDLPNIILVGCWAHARRKFDEALKSLPTNKRDLPVVAKEGLEYCNKLFKIEQDLQDKTPQERYEERLKSSSKVLDDFFAWLKYQKPRVLPKSKFGEAIQYCLNQWAKLTAFLQDGRLELDNNRSERSIKPFVIGRKNWLFSNSAKGANSSAIIYSVIETAKENKLKPFEYLTYLFTVLPNIDITDIDTLDNLLPWANSLPDNCKLKTN